VAVVDAGPLYAYVDADDRHHQTCRDLLATYAGPLVVPMLVITDNAGWKPAVQGREERPVRWIVGPAWETDQVSRFRLYPTPAQEAALLGHCAQARFVWNLALEQANYYGIAGRKSSPSFGAQCRQLTEARSENEWLAAGSQTVQQQALRDLDQAWRNSCGGTHPRPTWRKLGRHDGFRIVGPQAGRCTCRHLRCCRSQQAGDMAGHLRVLADRSGRKGRVGGATSVYHGCMTRTNVDLDDELVTVVMQRFNLRTKKDAVDFALRRLAGPPLTKEFLVGLRGIGWEGDLAEMRTSTPAAGS
jgi:Arc/MetJ family transcription regulator